MKRRVVAKFGRRYLVAPLQQGQSGGPGSEQEAIVRGRRSDIVVGDVVECSTEQDQCVIEAIDERRNLLLRADESRIKPLAANVDQIAIVFAPQPAPQKEFAWRALLAARAAQVDALAILNKIDLDVSAGDDARTSLQEIATLGARTLRVSAKKDPQGARDMLDEQCRGRVTLFVGQSGMGKSTMLNLLVGGDLRTGALSSDGRHGRQTTTFTRWFDYAGHGAVIDSPGFHEFGITHVSSASLVQWMPDFAGVPGSCRFANCRHAEEPGCVIRAAVEAREISEERYAFYRKLLAQAATPLPGR